MFSLLIKHGGNGERERIIKTEKGRKRKKTERETKKEMIMIKTNPEQNTNNTTFEIKMKKKSYVILSNDELVIAQASQFRSYCIPSSWAKTSEGNESVHNVISVKSSNSKFFNN